MKTEFHISEKIYAQLLSAYPRSHRERYGVAMVQLFRDQCRDAWAESGNFGLLKLWLRALPDLVGSSIMERLAALRERKTMNDELANLSSFQNYSPRKTFYRVFWPVFLLVVIVITITTFLLPVVYVSESRIVVENGDFDTRNSLQDYGFVRSELQKIQAPEVLNPVIEQLKLNEVWGKKYFAGKSLESSETYLILKNRITIWPIESQFYHKKINPSPVSSENRPPMLPVFDKKMFSIQCYSEDRVEASQIANAIAKSYQDLLNSRSVATVETKLQPGPVQIIDIARPAPVPIRPNKPRNITLGVLGGIVFASIVGLLVLVAKGIIARRKAGMAAA